MIVNLLPVFLFLLKREAQENSPISLSLFSRSRFRNPACARMAYPKSHNPFADDDDEPAGPRKGFNFDDDEDEDLKLTPAERRQRQLEQEVMRTAESAVDSSYRSLGLVYESEKIGTETAEVRCS